MARKWHRPAPGAATGMPRKPKQPTRRVRVFTVQQVARLHGVADRRIRQIIESGELKAYRKRGRWWIEEWEAYCLVARPRRSVGRRLSQAIAWGAVAVLGGWETPWLDASGRHRVRAKLRTSMTADLAVEVEAGLGDVPDYAMNAGLLCTAGLIRVAASEYAAERKTALAKLAAIHAYWFRRDADS